MSTAQATAEIRPATSADIAAIVPLMSVFNAEEHITFTPERGAAGLASLMHNPGWGFVLAAEVDGALHGYALVAFSFDIEYGGRDAFLCELFVAREARGRGLGKALLEAATGAARRHGAAALHLIVRGENARAKGLYERSGFVHDPRLLMTKALEPR